MIIGCWWVAPMVIWGMLIIDSARLKLRLSATWKGLNFLLQWHFYFSLCLKDWFYTFYQVKNCRATPRYCRAEACIYQLGQCKRFLSQLWRFDTVLQERWDFQKLSLLLLYPKQSYPLIFFSKGSELLQNFSSIRVLMPK